MKIGNLLLGIAGLLSYTSLMLVVLLAAIYMEHSLMFKLLTIIFISSSISWMCLFAIKNEK